MSRHSLPSSDAPRHGVADDTDDPRVTVPRPRTTGDSRHAAGATARIAADLLGATTGNDGAAPDSGHAAARPAGPSRHAAVDEPVTGALPVVSIPTPRAEHHPGPATTEFPVVGDAGSAPAEDARDRPTRRHAAPQRHRRRAHAPAGETSRPGRGRRLAAGIGGRPRAAAVLLTAVVALVALPTVGSASVDQCTWQVAAHDLLVSLDGRTDQRSEQLRRALTRAGIGTQLPAECATPAPAPAAVATGSTAPTATHRTPRSTPPTSAPTTKPSAAKPTTAAPKPTTAAPAPAPAGGSTGTGTTAAAAQGWGTPTRSDDFTAGLGQWGIYDGSGHAGNGRRTTSAVTTANGIMTMTGDTSGNTGGMAWGSGQKYGRWEARVRSTAGSYHPVMLLWPDAENWPVGGEVDWMEISDSARQVADTFLHYGAGNNQVQGNVKVDATQWHNWAVEWTPQGITTYLDGKAWWSTKNTSILPPGPMHMTIQLDNFGGRNTATQMQVDWVKQYQP